MDAVLFRSAHKLENIQFRLGVAASEAKKVIQNFSQTSRTLLLHYLQSSPALELQTRLNNIFAVLIHLFSEARHSFANRVQPFLKNFTWKWMNTPMLICFAGFVFGTTIGFLMGRHIYQRNVIISRDKMQAIQCLSYHRHIGSTTDVVSLVHGADAPNVCRSHEVIVQVEAGSLQTIDLGIAKGYGRHMRYCLNKFSTFREGTCPVTLGRDCVGTVRSVGLAVRRLEVGDSVWVAVPYWAPGVLAQRIIVPEDCVAVRPARFGVQASCSFPYAGATALHTLRDGRILDKTDAANKRVLILGGCTPVGCLLTQILTAWAAHVTATCPAHAPPVMEALGAADIIPIHDNTMFSPSNQRATGDYIESRVPSPREHANERTQNSIDSNEDGSEQLVRHLRQRPPFDLVIVTLECHLTMNQLLVYCVKGGMVLDTRPMALDSDRYSVLRVSLFGWWMYCRLFIKGIFGSSDLNSYNEVPMNFEVLDKLSSILEKYRIKPVIGKVYHATDIVTALKQVSATSTIGTTVVTFHR